MARIAINGFGRIGRLFLRQALENRKLEIVAINDLGDIENLAYLLKYDSVYGPLKEEVSFSRDKFSPPAGKNYLIVGRKKILVLQEKDPANLPWHELKIDVVVEATGAFESFTKAAVHIKKAGAKRVVITAPAKDEEGTEGGRTVLAGVNQESLGKCEISSNGSCTTNAAASVAAVLSENPGIIKAVLNTVHGVTATQNLTDGPTRGKDFRRGRAAAANIVPSTTGAAIAVTRAVKSLDGKFDGLAIRVPVISGSLIDFTFVAKRKTSVEEINKILTKAASSSRWQGILAVTNDQLVSSDIIGNPHASIVDLSLTKVVDNTLVKVMAWYDNEWGYVATLVNHVLESAKNL